MKFRHLPWLLLCCGAGLAAAPALAAEAPSGSSPDAEDTAAQTKDIYSLDLKSLLDLKVTTASKFSEKLADAPGVMSVVTREELDRYGGLTLGEILERVLGLSVSTASFTDRSLVAMRGDQTKINGGHILFLINGRPTREILEGGLIGDLLESFPVSILERIEIIRGPGSVLYGSNAFSGVINLITRKADHNELDVTGLGAQGGGAATSGNLLLERGNFSLVGSSQFHQTPTWFTMCSSPVSGFQGVAIPDRSTGAYLGINYKGLSAMSSFTEYTTDYLEGMVGTGRWRRGFADLGYHLKARDNWEMDFNLDYTRATLLAAKSIPFIDRDSNDAVAEWTNVLTLFGRDRLTFGALFNYIHGLENIDSVTPKEAVSDGSRNAGAFYAQMDHALLDNLKLIGGIQANKIGSIALNVVPRAGVIWSPASRWSVKALYSQAFRAPSINETSINYGPPPGVPGPSLTGDPGLLPEKVATVDLGLSYQNNRVQAGVDYFHSVQTDSIILDSSTMNWRYVNRGRTTFQGGELEGKYYFRKRIFAMGSAMYQGNHDSDGDRNVTPVPNFEAKAGVSYESSRRFVASLFNVFEGPLPGYSDALNPKPSAYDLLNGNFRYDLPRSWRPNPKTGLALVAHADDLLNHAVWLPDWQDTPGDTIFYKRGRSVYVGVEVTVGKE